MTEMEGNNPRSDRDRDHNPKLQAWNEFLSKIEQEDARKSELVSQLIRKSQEVFEGKLTGLTSISLEFANGITEIFPPLLSKIFSALLIEGSTEDNWKFLITPKVDWNDDQIKVDFLRGGLEIEEEEAVPILSASCELSQVQLLTLIQAFSPLGGSLQDNIMKIVNSLEFTIQDSFSDRASIHDIMGTLPVLKLSNIEKQAFDNESFQSNLVTERTLVENDLNSFFLALHYLQSSTSSLRSDISERVLYDKALEIGVEEELPVKNRIAQAVVDTYLRNPELFVEHILDSNRVDPGALIDVIIDRLQSGKNREESTNKKIEDAMGPNFILAVNGRRSIQRLDYYINAINDNRDSLERYIAS